jgi:hypothetical protein
MALLYPESEYNVTITDDFVRVEHPSESTVNIFWRDLQEITIVTTDEGPFNADVWLVLKGAAGMIRIPQGNPGYDTVYERVSTLDGFNFQGVIDAMMSTENNEFVLWKKIS